MAAPHSIPASCTGWPSSRNVIGPTAKRSSGLAATSNGSRSGGVAPACARNRVSGSADWRTISSGPLNGSSMSAAISVDIRAVTEAMISSATSSWSIDSPNRACATASIQTGMPATRAVFRDSPIWANATSADVRSFTPTDGFVVRSGQRPDRRCPKGPCPNRERGR